MISNQLAAYALDFALRVTREHDEAGAVEWIKLFNELMNGGRHLDHFTKVLTPAQIRADLALGASIREKVEENSLVCRADATR